MRTLIFVSLLGLMPAVGLSQGPRLSFLAAPGVELPWASMYLTLEGGARMKVPFLPMVSTDRAPLGTANYTRDVRVNAQLVFAGNGSGPRSADDSAFTDKAVLLVYDVPDSSEAALRAHPLAERIRRVAAGRPSLIVLMSASRDYPFPMFDDSAKSVTPEVPVVIVGRRAGEMIFAAAGPDGTQLRSQLDKGEATPITPLDVRIDLRMNGKFRSRETPRFRMYFEPSIDSATTNRVALVSDSAAELALRVFERASVAWPRPTVVHFLGYDSKVFYVHHLGRALATSSGIFTVFDSGLSGLALAVHESTHMLLDASWGESSSFMSEGFGKYAEVMATQPRRNHIETAAFLKRGELAPLSEIVEMSIGSDKRTIMAYAAAGSFVGYLVRTFGIERVREAYRLEGRAAADRAAKDSWLAAFGKPLATLETAWRTELARIR